MFILDVIDVCYIIVIFDVLRLARVLPVLRCHDFSLLLV